MGKPRPGFKKGELIEYCIFCGKLLPSHKKSCPLSEELQDLMAKTVYCPLCGDQVVGEHVC